MRHTFEKDGIYINPQLPEEFDCTPHEERDEEMNWWWDKPYMIIDELVQESWEEHYHRLKSYDWTDDKIGSKEEWDKHLEEQKENWYENFPTGFRYTIRVLDGGAWDRSTGKGTFNNFNEALKTAKEINTMLSPFEILENHLNESKCIKEPDSKKNDEDQVCRMGLNS